MDHRRGFGSLNPPMDLRLKEIPFDFNGLRFKLRCNMNVLADVQEMNGGIISPALDGKRGQKSALQFLAAMMNDYADEQGWFDPDETGKPIVAKAFTPRGLGRILRFDEIPSAEIVSLVIQALAPPTGNGVEAPGNEDPAGN